MPRARKAERGKKRSAAAPLPTPAADEPRPHEQRNFLLMVIYQVLMRTGWSFKTESVIMPAVLDVLSGNSDMLRGWLPFLNRFGQSVPPLLMARRVKILPKKKYAFIATTTAMALSFAGLTAIFVV